MVAAVGQPGNGIVAILISGRTIAAYTIQPIRFYADISKRQSGGLVSYCARNGAGDLVELDRNPSVSELSNVCV